jgi:hypothetical protein
MTGMTIPTSAGAGALVQVVWKPIVGPPERTIDVVMSCRAFASL